VRKGRRTLLRAPNTRALRSLRHTPSWLLRFAHVGCFNKLNSNTLLVCRRGPSVHTGIDRENKRAARRSPRQARLRSKNLPTTLSRDAAINHEDPVCRSLLQCPPDLKAASVGIYALSQGVIVDQKPRKVKRGLHYSACFFSLFWPVFGPFAPAPAPLASPQGPVAWHSVEWSSLLLSSTIAQKPQRLEHKSVAMGPFTG
jgi:hypothetical protein